MQTSALAGGCVTAVALGEPDGFSAPFPQVEKLCPSCLSASDSLYLRDIRRIQREDTLDTLVSDDPPDDESFVNSPSFTRDYGPGEYLNPLLAAFLDLAMNINGIAHFEMWNVFPEAFAFYSIQ